MAKQKVEVVCIYREEGERIEEIIAEAFRLFLKSRLINNDNF